MSNSARSPEPSAAEEQLVWTPRQLVSGLLLSAAVIVAGSFASCSTAEKVPATASAPAETTVAAGPTDPAGSTDAAATLDHCARLLAAADELYASTPAVEAVFHKRERLAGVLEEPNVIQLKVRRQPMAVYMRWDAPDQGREAIWREDAGDGQIHVRPGGWKGRLIPVVKVDPLGARATAGSRRPINTTGPWHFTSRLVALVQAERDANPGPRVTLDEVTLHGQPCRRFTLVHAVRQSGGAFQRAVLYFELDRQLPIGFELYAWPADAGSSEPQLEESYAFQNLELKPRLEDADFVTASKPRSRTVR
ncbi:MAG TPA: DUF1571 domain-containing protein [Pirellulales bacterium]|jgi:hypothetical protein|nr:DUF1571 domain-containing protein [Pirellulales bacterium]